MERGPTASTDRPAAPAAPAPKSAQRDGGAVLDPVERLSEVLFGLIMALTFTGSIHAAQAGREDLKTILIGAIGCNLAWGIVDAVTYLMSDLVARGRALRSLQALNRAATAEEARGIIEEALPERIARAMKPADFDALRLALVALPEPVRRAPVTARALRGALGVFLLVTLSTFPVVLPLFFVQDPTRALRTSHAVAITMLFLIGSALGRYAGLKPWITGLTMLVVGLVLAALTILLGG
jgi:VIT1/CCC1 family predicted Fe2+/Mn2+ transporter